MSDVVEQFPESAKWQLLLLLMEMQETEGVKTFLESMSKFSDSSVRFADSAEKLPVQLRKELSILIQEIDDKQINLQTTLEKTEKTIVAIEQALAKANKVAASFQTTANSVNQAATAWEKAAIATDKALAGFNKSKTPRQNAATKSPFSIKDYQDTAESIGETVNEIHKLIESKQFLEFSFMPRKIANLLAWRLGQLIFLTFVLAVIYRVVIIRFVNKPE
jgi:phage shock protein A